MNSLASIGERGGMKTELRGRICDLFAGAVIVDDLQGASVRDVIKELLAAISASGRLRPSLVHKAIEGLMRREAIGTTAVGGGVAAPHAKLAALDGMVAAIGRSKSGIDFAALDNAPVFLVFLVLAPKNSGNKNVLSKILRLGRHEQLVRGLREAKEEAAIRELISQTRESLVECRPADKQHLARAMRRA